MKPDYAELDRGLEALGCPYLIDEPMDLHTTFRIGGPADRFVTVETPEALSALLALLRAREVPFLLLGNGSDLLVADEGIRGCVVTLGGAFREITEVRLGRVRAGAGAQLSAVCAFARDHALTGLEFAWGIPGTVGGAVFMDAGAYGGEMRDVISSVTHMGPDGRVETAAGEALAFGYRRSRYTESGELVLFAELTLAPGEPQAIAAKMGDLMARRKAKQPYDLPSAGSVFKRPKNGYTAPLIEQCGLKGLRVGDAQVSEKHAGFIVNLGGATCLDVLTLIDKVREEVFRQTGTLLECEVRRVGGPA